MSLKVHIAICEWLNCTFNIFIPSMRFYRIFLKLLLLFRIPLYSVFISCVWPKWIKNPIHINCSFSIQTLHHKYVFQNSSFFRDAIYWLQSQMNRYAKHNSSRYPKSNQKTLIIINHTNLQSHKCVYPTIHIKAHNNNNQKSV